MDRYEIFYLNNGIKSYRGPFWNEFKRIRREVNKTHNSFFIWNNINKIGRIGKGNVQQINKLQFKYFNIVKDELKILKPRVLVFLTGDDYDHFIRKNIEDFSECKIDDCLSELKFSNEFAHLKAYKTFHPNALYHKGKNRIVINQLIELIKKSCI
ncbi:hypothetical protein GCM10023183_13150 [Nibribacter koreensis]|uniref:Uracil DNA glycosylase superfamily protein n=2 Tax=Nibribacter koreensis TaxID=1084519 RepID=A0ABP8FEJ0_9BACT